MARRLYDPGPVKRALRSLGARVVLLLTVALLPIGAIALYQTHEVRQQAELRVALALQALTESAVRNERTMLQNADGVMAHAGAAMALMADDPVTCTQLMQRFLSGNPEFVFFAFSRTGERSDCMSSADPDMRGIAQIESSFWDKPERNVTADFRGRGGEPLIIMTYPVTRSDRMIGALRLAITLSALQAPSNSLEEDGEGPVELITFNREGTVLTSTTGLADVAEKLPRDDRLADFVGQNAFSFTGDNNKGERRAFALVPILPGTLYALGAYGGSTASLGPVGMPVPAWVFPILMWVVSLIVAYTAIEHLVIRHIRRLQREMLEFTKNRRPPEPSHAPDKPQELRDIDAAFLTMTETLLHDEAEMENAMHEKIVLLREVHHRVKNNLQLISSIMNMKMRKTSDPETIRILKRLQKRVLGLARVHQGLYEAQNFNSLDITDLANAILEEMEQMTADSRKPVQIIREINPVALFPDQAVPLSLLLSEATTNAIKFADAPEGDTPWIKVEIYADEPDHACLVISNSIDMTTPETAGNRGLGRQLITAFNSQLEGELNITRENGVYKVAVRFKVASVVPAPRDY
ncbi:sensor histidine kinase [Pontibaca methylaminivorans]|uniref:histidine kinase n=1 Tax=Pontibaca methylaminivorans TaxID=515897 RepID=A0A1R3WU24_9RHOB|nr:sensor histidine kinase [Pontibaca methylaminivorans]SIT80248.1 Two-component sensor histidine kinase, contains HisKA and HATPase domains [Pontibaca methylaminivorans]